MLLHKSNGDYNTESSIYVCMLNPRCTEEDIIEEINLVFKEERIRREKSLTRENMGKGDKVDLEKKNDSKVKVKIQNFILSFVVSLSIIKSNLNNSYLYRLQPNKIQRNLKDLLSLT